VSDLLGFGGGGGGGGCRRKGGGGGRTNKVGGGGVDPTTGTFTDRGGLTSNQVYKGV
jgi:hypothetical protein